MSGDADPRVLHDGRVVGSDGAGLSGALVYVKSGTGPAPEIAFRSGRDGRFRIALPPGRYVLEARSAQGQLGETELATGREAMRFEITIAR